MNKQFGFCERCGAKLAGDKIWWLELDQRTGTYTDQEVPAEFSQGGFAFGKDCAKIMLAEHKAAEQKMHPTDGGLPASDSLSTPATIGG